MSDNPQRDGYDLSGTAAVVSALKEVLEGPGLSEATLASAARLVLERIDLFEHLAFLDAKDALREAAVGDGWPVDDEIPF
jgi:hypothetical protein